MLNIVDYKLSLPYFIIFAGQYKTYLTMRNILIALRLLLAPACAQAQSNLTAEQQLEQARQEAEQAKQALQEAKKAAKLARQKAKEEARQKAEEEAKKAQAEQQRNAEIQKEIEKAKAEAQQYKEEAAKLKKEAEQAGNEQMTTTQGWTLPDQNTAKPVAPAKKDSKKDDDDEKNNPRYLAGAVPQDAQGDVVFTLDLDVPGKTAADIYQTTLSWMGQLVQGEDEINSRVALVDPKDHKIAATMKEWLTFRRNFISTDRTQFYYTLVAECTDGHLNLQMIRLSYLYEEGRPTELKISAEDWITDKKAINKKGTKLLNGSGKFRRLTIDRKDEIFASITNALK